MSNKVSYQSFLENDKQINKKKDINGCPSLHLIHEGQIQVIRNLTKKKTLMQLFKRTTTIQLRNEFTFWKVHGIMNTSGLVQSK